jgi:hypothetical protein
MKLPTVAATETGIQAGPRQLNDYSTVADLGEVADTELADGIKTFMDEAMGRLESLFSTYQTSRENEDFTTRQDVNARRTATRLDQSFDAHGNVVKQYKDGHAELGIRMGWTQQGCDTASAILRQGLLESSKRPYVVMGRGERRENRNVEKMVTALVDDMLRRGGFKRVFPYICDLCPRIGTGILRYEMGREARYEMVKEGVWEERMPILRPKFSVWPLEHVYVSHPKLPEASDQEGVFWLIPDVTLAQLEEDEIIQTPDGRVSGGKFRNLETVRKMAEDYQSVNSGSDSSSFFPRATLVEYEGALPILGWVKKELLTWRIARFFGVDVGEDPNPLDEQAVLKWGRKLARITHWRVSYLKDWSGGVSTSSSTGRILLDFAPLPQNRNSLYKFGWARDSLKFYQLSFPDLGKRLEDAADGIRNSDLWTTYFNSHPSVVANETGLWDQTIEEVQKLLHTPDALVKGRSGISVRDIVQFMQLPVDVNAEGKIAVLKQEFEETTRVNGAAKGTDKAPGSGTLGEIQMNSARSTQKLNDVILNNSQELCRLMKDILRDLWMMFQRSASQSAGQPASQDGLLARLNPFVEYASMVSGLPPSDIEKILPSVDELPEEVDFVNPVGIGSDRTVTAQLMLNGYQVTAGEAFPDKVTFMRNYLEYGGVARAEDITQSNQGMDPSDEERMLAQGTWVAPDPKEDLAAHLMSHAAAMNEVQQRISQGEVRPEDEVYLAQLGQHIQQTLQLIGLQMQMMQMEAEMSGQPDGGAVRQPGTKEGKSKPAGAEKKSGSTPVKSKNGKASQPQKKEAVGSDVIGQARRVPNAR